MEWIARQQSNDMLCVKDCEAASVPTLPPILTLPPNTSAKFPVSQPSKGTCSLENLEQLLTPYCRNKVGGLDLSILQSGELFHVSIPKLCTWWGAQKICRERGLRLWTIPKDNKGLQTQRLFAHLNTIAWLKGTTSKWSIWAGGTNMASPFNYYWQHDGSVLAQSSLSPKSKRNAKQCLQLIDWTDAGAQWMFTSCSETAYFLCEVRPRCVAKTCVQIVGSPVVTLSQKPDDIAAVNVPKATTIATAPEVSANPETTVGTEGASDTSNGDTLPGAIDDNGGGANDPFGSMDQPGDGPIGDMDDPFGAPDISGGDLPPLPPTRKAVTTRKPQAPTSKAPSNKALLPKEGVVPQISAVKVSGTGSVSEHSPLQYDAPPGSLDCAHKTMSCTESEVRSSASARVVLKTMNPPILKLCGKKFYISFYPKTYFEASNQCCQDKMFLASIGTEEELECIKTLYNDKKTKKKKVYWTGGLFNKSQENYRWCSSMGWGRPFSESVSRLWFNNEVPSRNEDHCVVFKITNEPLPGKLPFGLAPLPCTSSQLYICESPEDIIGVTTEEPVTEASNIDCSRLTTCSEKDKLRALTARRNKATQMMNPKISKYPIGSFYISFTSQIYATSAYSCCTDTMTLINVDSPGKLEILTELHKKEKRKIAERYWVGGYVDAARKDFKWCGKDKKFKSFEIKWLPSEPNYTKTNEQMQCLGVKMSKTSEVEGLFVNSCNLTLRYICETENVTTVAKNANRGFIHETISCTTSCPFLECSSKNDRSLAVLRERRTAYSNKNICGDKYMLSSIKEDFESATRRCACLVKNYRPLTIKSKERLYCVSKFIREQLNGLPLWTSGASLNCSDILGWCATKEAVSEVVKNLISPNTLHSNFNCLALVKDTMGQITLSRQNCSNNYATLCESAIT